MSIENRVPCPYFRRAKPGQLPGHICAATGLKIDFTTPQQGEPTRVNHFPCPHRKITRDDCTTVTANLNYSERLMVENGEIRTIIEPVDLVARIKVNDR